MFTTLEARGFLRGEHDNHHNVWNGKCLMVQRIARDVTPVYDSAWDNIQDMDPKYKHLIDRNDSIIWWKIPTGATLWYWGPPHSDGRVYGHVTQYIGMTRVGPLCWTNDSKAATPGSIDLVHPLWFESHWGHRLIAWGNMVERTPLGLDIPTAPPTHRVWCSLAAIQKAARFDPDRMQGGITPGCQDDVRVVENALMRWGHLAADYAHDGSFGSATLTAYRLWQNYLGYKGSDADGIPGFTSLSRLGARYGFHVAA